jgi:hypothetical protein
MVLPFGQELLGVSLTNFWHLLAGTAAAFVVDAETRPSERWRQPMSEICQLLKKGFQCSLAVGSPRRKRLNCESSTDPLIRSSLE